MALPRGTDVEYIGANASGGMSLGMTTSEKVSFYGVTPIIQRTTSTQVAISASVINGSASGGSGTWGFASSTQATQVVTLVNELREALVAIGVIAGS